MLTFHAQIPAGLEDVRIPVPDGYFGCETALPPDWGITAFETDGQGMLTWPLVRLMGVRVKWERELRLRMASSTLNRFLSYTAYTREEIDQLAAIYRSGDKDAEISRLSAENEMLRKTPSVEALADLIEPVLDDAQWGINWHGTSREIARVALKALGRDAGANRVQTSDDEQ